MFKICYIFSFFLILVHISRTKGKENVWVQIFR